MILRLALLLVAAAGLLSSGCATQRGGDSTFDRALAAPHRSAEKGQLRRCIRNGDTVRF